MPGPDRRTHFRYRIGGANLNQDDDRGGDRRRDHGMQHDAKLAVIGVACRLVYVGYLNKRKQGQQQQAQHRGRHREGARSGPVWLKTVQKPLTPYFKDTQNWMRRSTRRLHAGLWEPKGAYRLDSYASKM